ncbi:DUF803 domain-containing protein [Arthroderma uncinatum]|uniref:DUF803 domain-containing protein n=1 Tax=Arthroderma uncinatum TaxID=74035 RepID=UPI00144A5A4B|nr:DUF803 domain-containing protein [Arthroderma uncinatum]KAF3491401.1 DUF803 domain-containing protein [Arthroderma uncinatum]
MGILEMGLGHLSPAGGIAVGVLVGVISTSLQAVGLTLQRKSHMLEDEKFPYDTRRPAFKRRRWQIGMFMFVSANIVGSTIQITTLPLPVLSTLQASGLVFNTIFATLILGEPFTRYSVIGTFLVCAGAILIATFGAIGEPAHTLDQLLELLVRPPFLRWMAGTAVVVMLLVLGARALRVASTPGQTRNYMSVWSLPPHSYHSPRIKLFRGMIYGSLSGILSAHCLLLAKTAVELVVRTIADQENQFVRWQSWIILLALVSLALTQMYYMHRGLKLCSTSILYPYVFCIYNIIAILDGLIYFHQTSQLSGLHAGLIAVGTVILLCGVLCLSWRLEDVSAHPGQAAVPPPTTAIGPGLGLIEEPSASPTSYTDLTYPGDEESRPGERQPLLLHTPRHRHQQPTTFSHPHRISTLPHRRTTNSGLEAAEIWAELRDDQDDELDDHRDSLVRSALLPPDSPSSLRRHSKRQRRKSAASLTATTGHRRLFSLWGTPGETPVPTANGVNSGENINPKESALFRGLSWRPRQALRANRLSLRRTPTPLITEQGATHRGLVERDVGSNAGQASAEEAVAVGDETSAAPQSNVDPQNTTGILASTDSSPYNNAGQSAGRIPYTRRVGQLWNSGTHWFRSFIPGNASNDD